MTASSLVPSCTAGGHVCCAFEDQAAFERLARAFLAEGEAKGERVRFVDAHEARSLYRAAAFDAEASVAAYRAEAERAVEDGYAGLRVAADATPLVGTADARRDFVRYEHLVDRFMRRDRIFTAMCGYDAVELGSSAVAELAAVHPASMPDVAGFHVFAAPDGDLVLTGQLDIATAELLATTLAHVSAGDGVTAVDVSGVEFADHRSLEILDRFAASTPGTIVLRAARPVVQRAARCSRLEHLVVL